MNIQTLLGQLISLINGYIIPFLIAIAIVVFFWGIVQYIFGAGSGEGKTKAVQLISAGIIGLVVMLSIWGIVALVTNSLGIGGTSTIVPPSV